MYIKKRLTDQVKSFFYIYFYFDFFSKKSFDFSNTIITNPPIRAGKKVVYDIVMNAKEYLCDSGSLFLVIRKEQGAKSLIFDLEKIYNVNILQKKKGFFILKCTF